LRAGARVGINIADSFTRSYTLPGRLFLLLLYLGPEVLMPIASVFAAIGGVLLMFWNRVRDGVRVLFGGGRREESVTPESDSDTAAS
jgi:hypothetical protein